MNNSFLNSVKNTVSSSKPSKAIRLLVVAFFVLVQTVVFGATITSTAKGGNWSDKSTWVGGVVPESSDNVIIATGSPALVTVTTNTEVNSITITGSGILTINDGETLTIYGNVDVASRAKFNAGTGNSDSATIKVYGNFINYGAANFWKSTVVIGGDLDTASTILQNNGEIIVGGNVSGVIGGSGKGIVYPVNPNAIVVVSGDAKEKPAGTFPPAGTLLDLTYEVIFGTCPFTVNNLTNVSACSGSNAVFTISTKATAPKYQWQVNIDGSGWANLSNSAPYSGVTTSTLTITGVAITMNNNRYRTKITDGSTSCTKNGNYGVLTVSEAPAAPTPAPPKQPTCTVPTGSVVLSGLPTGTWTITRNPGAVKTEGTGSSTTVSNLASGTYTFTVSNGSCTSAASNNVVINARTNTWNVVSGVGSWTNTLTNSQAITFNGDYNSTGDLSACSCTVNTGKKVTIKSGHNLIITNGVTVSGTLTFEDSASLVQINSAAVNSGNITYKRYTSIRSTDYTYWSSPVSSYTLGGVSQNKTLSDKYYSFNSTIDNWQQESAATVMNPGVGYIVRGPELKNTSNLPPPPVGLFEASFIGVPNNGNKSITSIIKNKSYLLGNPYPSAIDADEFLIANKDVLNGTLYFWTNHTEIGTNVSNPGTGVLAYSSDDYATYNATGGVGAADPDLDPKTRKPYRGSAKPNGTIAAGQGFFASSKTTLSGTSIVFKNDMRLVGTTSTEGIGANQQFFKTKNTKSKTTNLIEKNRIWLNLKNNQGAFKQTLIGYITDATNEYDSSFDGESFDGNEFVDFYSINQEKNLVIQGRALPFDENDAVPLGFRSTIEGDFTITIDETDGLLTNQPVFLEDKLTNKVFDLKSGNYTFNTIAGTFDDRFVLRYTNKTLSIDETDKEDGILVLYSNNYKTLIIHNNNMDTTVNSVALFNITGQNIANWEVNDSEQTNIQFPIKTTSSGIYIVKVKTTKGESSKKIIIR